MEIKPIAGEIKSQPLNDNFSVLDSKIKDKANKSQLENLEMLVRSRPAPRKQTELRPTLTILDDDTRTQLYDVIFPILQQKQIPLTAAVVSSRVGNHSNTISYAQFLEMRDSGLVEFVNHTHEHVHLDELSEEEIDYQIRTCQEWLYEQGIFTSHLVYPFGRINATIRRIASKYVASASKTNGLINNPNTSVLDSYFINRVNFDSSIQTIKNRIDEAKNSNGWIIVNTHSQTVEPSKFIEMIDYAISEGLEIESFEKAYVKFNNILELRNYNGDLITGISARGFSVGLAKGYYLYHPSDTDLNTRHINDPPSAYPFMQESSVTISGSNASAGGWPGAGRLITFRGHNDDYTYQIFIPIRSSNILHRSWDSSNPQRWTPFESLHPQKFVENLGPYSIEFGASQNIRINSPILQLGKSVTVTPNITIPNGVTYSFCVDDNGTGLLRLYNVREGIREVPNGNWIFAVE